MDDDELLDAVARSPVPVAVALGHASDRPVLDEVADSSFPTPTAFGAWVKNTLEQRRAHFRQAEEAEAVEGAQGLKARLQALQESNKLLNENLEKAARARQEVEEKLLGQQKQLLDQAEATCQQLNAAQKENVQLRQAAQAQQADWQSDVAQLSEQLVKLQASNEGLRRTVEQLRAERDRSAAGARLWVRVAVATGIVCVVGWIAVVLVILAR